jgi:hypothetical protein
VNFGSNAVDGNISVHGSNSCGDGTASNLGVHVNPIYSSIENISICSGESYSWHGTDYSSAGMYTANLTSISGCDSSFTLFLTEKPTFSFSENKTICEGSTYEWYGQNLTSEGIYHKTFQTSAGCDSVYSINLKVNPAYSITENHSICIGDSIDWHGQYLSNEGTYTANYQTINGCDSNYLIHLSINPEVRSLQVKIYLEGLYADNGLMQQANGVSGFYFGVDTADKVVVELHEATPPYDILYEESNLNLTTDGMLSIPLLPCNISGLKYIVIKHRNSIETWSAQPYSFSGSGPFSYDFSTAASQAYGSNLKLIGGIYALYGGDATQDGIVDGSDMAMIDNASMPPPLMGYNIEDINGDGLVDGSDMAIIDNNSMPPVVKVIRPE